MRFLQSSAPMRRERDRERERKFQAVSNKSYFGFIFFFCLMATIERSRVEFIRVLSVSLQSTPKRKRYSFSKTRMQNFFSFKCNGSMSAVSVAREFEIFMLLKKKYCTNTERESEYKTKKKKKQTKHLKKRTKQINQLPIRLI
ncbi:Krueppel [Sarcoptes scabiei]|nr:Krueppel [Sarcoptes scabiei]